MGHWTQRFVTLATDDEERRLATAYAVAIQESEADPEDDAKDRKRREARHAWSFYISRRRWERERWIRSRKH